MELKAIPMTDEYAAQYFHKNGYMWARLETMKEQETWGELRDQRIEKELREKIAQQVETLQSWVDETAATVMYKERVLETIRTGL